LPRDARIQRRQDACRHIGPIKLGDKFPEHSASSCEPTPSEFSHSEGTVRNRSSSPPAGACVLRELNGIERLA
jgi:hypothetical protein